MILRSGTGLEEALHTLASADEPKLKRAAVGLGNGLKRLIQQPLALAMQDSGGVFSRYETRVRGAELRGHLVDELRKLAEEGGPHECFFRDLAVALSSESSLLDALHRLAAHADAQRAEPARALERGLRKLLDAPFAFAMQSAGRLFTPYQIYAMQAAEKKGELVEQLCKLADLEDERRLKGLSREGKIRFFRELSILLGAGVSYARIFDLFGHDHDERFASLAKRLGRLLTSGQALSQTMGTTGKAFTPFQISMVKIGENTAELPSILGRLAEAEERSLGLQRKAQNALAGPCLTAALVAFLLIVVLPLVVFRAYLELIAGLNVPEVGLFGWLLRMMRFTQTPFWWGGLLGLATLAGICFSNVWLREQFVRSLLRLLSSVPKVGSYLRPLYESGQNWEGLVLVAEMLILEIPSLGRVWLNLLGFRFAFAFALQIESGVNASIALESSIEATGSRLWIHHRRSALDELLATGSFEGALGCLPRFPDLLRSTMKVGEEAGELPKLSRRVGLLLEDEFNHYLEVSQALLEPVMLLGLGLIIVGFAVLMLLPMSKVVQAL